MTLNFKLSNVPAPLKADVPKPETTNVPGVVALTVIVNPLESVPLVSGGVTCGVRTV